MNELCQENLFSIKFEESNSTVCIVCLGISEICMVKIWTFRTAATTAMTSKTQKMKMNKLLLGYMYLFLFNMPTRLLPSLQPGSHYGRFRGQGQLTGSKVPWLLLGTLCHLLHCLCVH